MKHCFNIEVAMDCGLNAAVILQYFYNWICHNRREGKNNIGGVTWTYGTQECIRNKVPYLSVKQIRNGVRVLSEKGYLSTGNYNKKAVDRTIWYSLTEKSFDLLTKDETHEGITNVPKGQMQQAKRANGKDGINTAKVLKGQMGDDTPKSDLTHEDITIRQKGHLQSAKRADQYQLYNNKLNNINTTTTTTNNIDKHNNVFQLWITNKFPDITEIIKDEIVDLIDEFGEPKVIYAIRQAEKQNKKSVAYVRGVCQGGKKNKTPFSNIEYKAVEE